jgi:hypothetical protein
MSGGGLRAAQLLLGDGHDIVAIGLQPRLAERA